jgi:hypothetical protein
VWGTVKYSQKWKATFQDQLRETSELEQTNRLSTVEIQTLVKTTHQEIKEGKRRKTALDIEHSWVSHVHDEAKCQHQHQMLVWDRKLELAWLQARVLSQMAAAPMPASSFTLLMSSFGDGSGLSTHSLGSSMSGENRLPPSSVSGGFGNWDLPMPGFTQDTDKNQL